MRPTCVLVLASCQIGIASAQGYLGADEALRIIRTPLGKESDPKFAFHESVQAFARRLPKLSTTQAADQWLALVDRSLSASAPWALQISRGGSFSQLVNAIPGPASWPRLESELTARANDPKDAALQQGLLAFLETLSGKQDEAWVRLTQLKNLTPEQEGQVARLLVDMALRSENKDRIEAAYRREFAAFNKLLQKPGDYDQIKLPDLIALLGPAQAQQLVAEMLRSYDGELVIDVGTPLRKMVREMALADVSVLKHPQWNLACDIEWASLFEAMHRQFPLVDSGISQNPDWEFNSFLAAATRYVAFLVANGRESDAFAFIKNQQSHAMMIRDPPSDEVALLRRRGRLEDYLTLLESSIKAGFNDFISRYLALSESCGQFDRAERFIAGLPQDQKLEASDLYRYKFDALFAGKQFKDAAIVAADHARQPISSKDGSSSYPDLAIELVDLGRNLHRQDYVDLGIQRAEVSLQREPYWSNGWVLRTLVAEHRGPEAEALAIKVLVAEVKGGSTSLQGEQCLAWLLSIYEVLGRNRDIVQLLEQAPCWGCDDIAYLTDESNERRPILLIAARALAAVGRKPEALRVVRFFIHNSPNFDPAYALLLELDPDGAGATLDTMHRVYPMATRPLIWKAKWLFDHHRIDQAFALIKQAIDLDPQDTEGFPFVTRFQGWEVLAEIEGAQGRTDLARLHRGKFLNPHKYFWSSPGDDERLEFDPAGDHIKGLAVDPDDFHLRFTVADDYKRAGKLDQAKAAYLEAARSLALQGEPESRGQFDSPEWSPECEAVLAGVLKNHPNNAGARATMGSYFVSVGKYGEAKDEYMQAAALNPDCLAALNGLDFLASKAILPMQLASKVGTQLARLSPYFGGSRDCPTNDYVALWAAVANRSKGVDRQEFPVFRLPRSTYDNPSGDGEYSTAPEWPPFPGSVLAGDAVVTDFITLISTLPGNAQTGLN